jgi:hypothetical protein
LQVNQLLIREALNEITEANGPKVPLTLAFDGDFSKPKFAKAIKKLDNYKDSEGNNLYTPTLRLDRDLDNKWAGFTVEKTKKELTFFLTQNLNNWRDTFGKPCTRITVGLGCPSNVIGVIKAGGLSVVVPGGLLSGVFKHGKDALNPQKISGVFIQKSGDKENNAKVSDDVIKAAKKLSDFGFYLVNADKVDKIEASINNNPEKNLNANEETNSPNTPEEDQDESNLLINPDDISDPEVQAMLFKYLEQKNNPTNESKLNKDINFSGTTVTEEEAKKKLLEEQNQPQVNKKNNDITDAQNSTAEQTKNGNKEGDKETADNTSSEKEGGAEADKEKKEQTEGDNGNKDDEGGIKGSTVAIIIVVVLAILVVLGIVYKKMKN